MRKQKQNGDRSLNAASPAFVERLQPAPLDSSRAPGIPQDLIPNLQPRARRSLRRGHCYDTTGRIEVKTLRRNAVDLYSTGSGGDAIDGESQLTEPGFVASFRGGGLHRNRVLTL